MAIYPLPSDAHQGGRDGFNGPAPNLIERFLIPAFTVDFEKIPVKNMLKLSEKASGQTGAKILLDAMSKDKVHLARFILDALDGKIIDSMAEGAGTPLITAALLPDAQARSKFLTLLLERGASVNRQDERGRTALSHACEHGHLDAVKVLVQNNADPELVDSWGNTALMYASVAGHSPVVDFLVRAFKRLGLVIDRQNNVGNSAVEVAKYLGHQDCLFALTSKAKKGHDNDRREADSNVGEDSLGRKSSDATEVNSPRAMATSVPKGVRAAGWEREESLQFSEWSTIHGFNRGV